MQLQQQTINYSFISNFGNNTHCPNLPRTVQFCPCPKVAPHLYIIYPLFIQIDELRTRLVTLGLHGQERELNPQNLIASISTVINNRIETPVET